MLKTITGDQLPAEHKEMFFDIVARHLMVQLGLREVVLTRAQLRALMPQVTSVRVDEDAAAGGYRLTVRFEDIPNA